MENIFFKIPGFNVPKYVSQLETFTIPEVLVLDFTYMISWEFSSWNSTLRGLSNPVVVHAWIKKSINKLINHQSQLAWSRSGLCPRLQWGWFIKASRSGGSTNCTELIKLWEVSPTQIWHRLKSITQSIKHKSINK